MTEVAVELSCWDAPASCAKVRSYRRVPKVEPTVECNRFRIAAVRCAGPPCASWSRCIPIIRYRIAGDDVVILRVRHTSRRPTNR
jgi:plasmid stabilization system protein ParE